MELSALQQLGNKKLSKIEIINSIYYHNIFGYPLHKKDLKRWTTGKVNNKFTNKIKVQEKKGYLFIKGKEDLVYKRLLNEKFSREKIKIAKKASQVLSLIPSIKMVGTTGSLAMMNANEDSDIDLMIVASSGTLWTTRLITYLLLKTLGINIRKSSDRYEKDKLCLNIWLDEADLKWRIKNIFTSHEIFQTKVLLNRENMYEKFVNENNWAKEYWPSAYIKPKVKTSTKNNVLLFSILRIFEPLAFWFQYNHMKGKITKETITPTRALFHPFDWSRVVRSSGF